MVESLKGESRFSMPKFENNAQKSQRKKFFAIVKWRLLFKRENIKRLSSHKHSYFLCKLTNFVDLEMNSFGKEININQFTAQPQWYKHASSVHNQH